MSPLLVSGFGICCPVGYFTEAACAAIHARLDRFKTSEFIDDVGVRLVTSSVPLGDLYGPPRLAAMARYAVAESLRRKALRPSRSALVLLLSDRDRTDFVPTTADTVRLSCEEEAREPFAAVEVLRGGRAGIAEAVSASRRLLSGGQAERALVVGVDSYLNPHAVNAFLRQKRLLSSEASDGFIPGEAAAALILEFGEAGVQIAGVGQAEDSAAVTGDEPVLGLGRSAAVRAALKDASCALDDIHFELTDISGEAFFARDLAHGMARVFSHRREHFPRVQLADHVGEVGAAAGPLSVAYLARSMPRADLPGRAALLHFANDLGLRAALVVRNSTEPS
ncbi:MAG: beta-ketoacyl synthase N-terminal-like domain-containing protein [Polyangiaceae bacterium]